MATVRYVKTICDICESEETERYEVRVDRMRRGFDLCSTHAKPLADLVEAVARAEGPALRTANKSTAKKASSAARGAKGQRTPRRQVTTMAEIEEEKARAAAV